MSNVHGVRNYIAGGTIAQYRFVKPGAADGEVLQAAAATDNIIGVCIQPGGAVAGERVDVQYSGIAEVEFVGVVARGALVTSDATGKGIAPAPAAGSNVRVGGIAEVTTAANDIARMLIALGSFQG